MNKTQKILKIAATPVVVVGIYAWLIRNAYLDAKTVLKRRWEAR